MKISGYDCWKRKALSLHKKWRKNTINSLPLISQIYLKVLGHNIASECPKFLCYNTKCSNSMINILEILQIRITRWYVRVLNHHTANGCHGAQAICCILNWNVFVLKDRNIINHSNFLSFYNCPATTKDPKGITRES